MKNLKYKILLHDTNNNIYAWKDIKAYNSSQTFVESINTLVNKTNSRDIITVFTHHLEFLSDFLKSHDTLRLRFLMFPPKEILKFLRREYPHMKEYLLKTIKKFLGHFNTKVVKNLKLSIYGYFFFKKLQKIGQINLLPEK